MRVEYLVLMDSDEQFCKSVESLNNLLQAYEDIDIGNGSISFKGNAFPYEAIYEEIGRENQRYFHLKLDCAQKDQLCEFRELLKSLRTILAKVSGRPTETLWDELSSDLCSRAYPLIHRTENLLRKLITKFMFANVGIGWLKEAIPKEVVDSVKSKSSERAQNYLYELDFIQLSNLLFREYATGDSQKIIEKLQSVASVKDLDLIELKELIPCSNWERYFAPIVDCESAYLKKRWERLYDLRCKVAHNRFLTTEELDEIKTLTSEVNAKLQQALDNLDKVQVSKDQMEEVAINMAANTNADFAHFLFKWDELNRSMYRLGLAIASDTEGKKFHANTNWRNLANFAIRKGMLPRGFKKYFTELYQFRNAIVHNPDVMFTTSSIYDRIAMVDRLIAEVQEITQLVVSGSVSLSAAKESDGEDDAEG